MGNGDSVCEFNRSLDTICIEELPDVNQYINKLMEECRKTKQKQLDILKDLDIPLKDIDVECCKGSYILNGSGEKTAQLFRQKYPNLNITHDHVVDEETTFNGVGNDYDHTNRYFKDSLVIEIKD